VYPLLPLLPCSRCGAGVVWLVVPVVYNHKPSLILFSPTLVLRPPPWRPRVARSLVNTPLGRRGTFLLSSSCTARPHRATGQLRFYHLRNSVYSAYRRIYHVYSVLVLKRENQPNPTRLFVLKPTSSQYLPVQYGNGMAPVLPCHIPSVACLLYRRRYLLKFNYQSYIYTCAHFQIYILEKVKKNRWILSMLRDEKTTTATQASECSERGGSKSTWYLVEALSEGTCFFFSYESLCWQHKLSNEKVYTKNYHPVCAKTIQMQFLFHSSRKFVHPS